MKYLVTGTTPANESEVVKSLEALWDAADAQDQPFELLYKRYWAETTDIGKAVQAWVLANECFADIVPDDAYIPPFDQALVLCGEEPDQRTAEEVQHWLNEGKDVYDLAGAMFKIEFEEEQLPEAPVEAEAPISTAKAQVPSGWPGDAPETPQEAPEPERSREVPAKAPAPPEDPQVDAKALLAGVSEMDLERMGPPALKGLVDKLGLTADKRSKGSMIAAVMEVIIAIDKGEVVDLADSGMYDQDAAEFFGEDTDPREAEFVAELKKALDADEAEKTEELRHVEEQQAAARKVLEEIKPVVLAGNPVDEQWGGPVIPDPGKAVVTRFIETVYGDGSVTKIKWDGNADSLR